MRAISASGPGTVIASSSAPVYAATTPGSSRAAETSTESTPACAIGERTNAACSIPGSLMLAPVYRSAAIAVMVALLCSVLPGARSVLADALGGQQHAVDDALVA